MDRRARVEQLFREACDRAPSDRERFLKEACAGDAGLYGEVESLLSRNAATAALALSMPEGAASPGSLLGPYQLESKLGRGGMGEVFRAVDTRLDRQVAVKVCSGAFADRFVREARAIAALNHPHICTLHDIGANFLVMELVEGETLAARLRKGPLPIAQVCLYGAQIADALSAAHAREIVHRDLKPANVMLARSGVKVLDFGLAQTAGDETLTATGQVVGTPLYMAPEQREGRECDARTDIYALGLILAEMATGKRPPQDLSPLPPRLTHVVERCLAADPDNRWQSARDVKLELEWAAQERASTAAKASRRWWLVGAAALAVSLALLAVAFLRLGPRDASGVVRLALPLPDDGNTADPPGVFGPPAISPDGSTVVLALGAGSNRFLWKRRLDSGAFERLEGTKGGNYPFWSPDGRQIAFFAGGKLKKMPTAGGDPQDLCLVGDGDERGGAWSADGTIVYGVNYAGLFRISAAGGAPAQIAGLDAALGENSLRHPRFLSDGKHFVCFSRTREQDNRGLYLYSLDSPGRKKLAVTDQQIDVARDPASGREFVLFSKSGKLWTQELDLSRGELRNDPAAIDNDVGLFSVSQTGTLIFRLTDVEQGVYTWFDRAGRELGAVGSPVDSWDVALSPDDRYAAFNNHRSLDGHFSIWLIDTARNVSAPFSAQAEQSYSPVWSRDSRLLYFCSRRGGGSQLYGRAVDDAAAERPFLDASKLYRLEDVSRDGNFLLGSIFHARSHIQQEDRSRELVYTAAGKEEWQPFVNGARGQFSPDGRAVAYESPESGSWEIYVVEFPGGRRKQRVSIAGGREPRWRADGRELIYYGPDGALWSAPFASNSLTGEPKRLFPITFSTAVDGFHYAISHDGQRILAMKETGRDRSRNLHVVINWPKLLSAASVGGGR